MDITQKILLSLILRPGHNHVNVLEVYPSKINFNKINGERKWDVGTFNFTLLADRYCHILIFIMFYNVTPRPSTPKVMESLKLI